MALAPVISDLFSWDPFRGFTTEALVNTPPIDWKETPAAHVYTADLPGLSKEEVRVEVEDGRVLKISGERPRRDGEDEGKGGTAWHCAERGGGGPFSRRFRLPEGADVAGMRARMEDGVLTVTVPKKKEGGARGKPAARKVEITSGGKEGKKGRGVKGVLCRSSAV